MSFGGLRCYVVSCFDGYNDTSIAYRIDILAQWEIVASKDMMFDEDARSSSHMILL